MRQFDLTPLYRQTVGFDRLFSMLDDMLDGAGQPAVAYPPYNIERVGETAYRITLAVAGFREDELGVELKDGALTVTGKRADAPDGKRFLHQGIAGRAFERRFQLAEHVEVRGAALENGLLHIELERVVPEEKKPRRIAIGRGEPAQPKVIDAKAA